MQWFHWAGAALILILSGYAGWLLGRLWQQSRRRHRIERLRRQQTCDSLEIIARSLIAGQVNVTEAALRMEVLLHNIEAPEPAPDLSAVHALADDCAHLAVGRHRQRLSPAEKQRQDRERETAEARHEPAVRSAARRLLDALPHWRAAC